MLDRRRPNTCVPDSFLSERCLLCCGEDYLELISALSSLGISAEGLPEHIYRCYRIILFDEFTLVWTGIGTGCLEPLLHEVLTSGLIMSITLIGTAGALNEKTPKGKAAFIESAINGVTPFATDNAPLEYPSSKAPDGALKVLSSDLYYGFSAIDSPFVTRLQQSVPGMRARFEALKVKADLIDMETAQFYRLCKVYGQDRLAFVAIKGAANNAADPHQQTFHSAAVLRSAVELGLGWLS